MQRLIWSVIIFLPFLFASNLKANPNDTLKVVNWNLEYFGDKASELPNEMIYTKTIMDSLNADIYALVEVVNKDSLISLVNSLNGDYGYMIAPFGTLATSELSSYWASDQKQAIIYRKSVVRNVTGRAFMKTSSSAYNDWGSGRFPFLVNAEILGADNKWTSIPFIIIHAKAYSDATSCTRRKDGAIELKDSLDQYFASSRFLILGDYNDDLDTTICSNYTVSNYENFVNDSLHYYSPTLALSRQGISSIKGYTSFIDHVIMSDEMQPYYVPNSTEMLKSKVNSWVSNYNTYLSDHYPVESKYIITTPTSVAAVFENSFRVFPNPTSTLLNIEQKQASPCFYELYSMTGQLIFNANFSTKSAAISVENLASGTYLLRITNQQKTAAFFALISKP